MDGRVEGRSRLHPGDGLAASFKLGETHEMRLRADAVEAQGGALAGALGLAADQRLIVKARVEGTTTAGALSLLASSGRATPLSLQGAWSPAGAHASGEIAFTASRLTDLFAKGAGPDARLALSATRRADGLYDVQGALTARDAEARLSGPVDWTRRRTPGLALKLSVADLSRWVAGVSIGPVTTDGRLTGELDRFDYKGRIAGRAAERGRL